MKEIMDGKIAMMDMWQDRMGRERMPHRGVPAMRVLMECGS